MIGYGPIRQWEVERTVLQIMVTHLTLVAATALAKAVSNELQNVSGCGGNSGEKYEFPSILRVVPGNDLLPQIQIFRKE